MIYSEYLKSPHWQETRKKRLDIDGYACTICGSKSNLNVHHVNYRNVGKENVETDLVTLCSPCHAMLHRVREQSEAEYKRAVTTKEEYRAACQRMFCKKISDLITVEIWLRDRANGGDIDTWDTGGGMIGRLKKIMTLLYPDAGFRMEYEHGDIKDTLRLARAMKICCAYRRSHSIEAVANMMNMKSANVQKVLKRHGFNATGRIR